LVELPLAITIGELRLSGAGAAERTTACRNTSLIRSAFVDVTVEPI
jgi:hypothetical protein